jgi:hypothetical protein
MLKDFTCIHRKIYEDVDHAENGRTSSNLNLGVGIVQ